jgi:hypothetical protein
MAGCGNLPRERLADCQNRSQLLQAEASRLKDDSTQLRGKNRELAQRAVEDARRLRGLEEANRRLEKSVVAYQDERDAVQSAFDDLKRELIAAADTDTRTAGADPLPAPEAPVRTALAAAPEADTEVEPEPAPDTVAATPEPEPLPLASADDDTPPAPGVAFPEALAAFAGSQPRTRLDPAGPSWTVPTALLFEPGSDTLSPRGAFLLASFARVADGEGVAPRSVAASPDAEPIRQAADDGTDPADLPDRRALAVRDHLARLFRADPDDLPAHVGKDTDADAEGVNPTPEITIALDLPR